MVSNLRLLVPLENENRWTDLLAVLISTDPAAAAAALDLGDITGRVVSVSREVRAGPHERVDLLIHVDGQLHTVLEAKVLSGLGPAQLTRYDTAYPDALQYVIAYPGRLVIDPGAIGRWRGATWESLLAAFSASSNNWVARTARAWLEHLGQTLPHVDGGTSWNHLEPGDPIALLMRARLSWVYSRLDPPAPLVADFMASGGSKGWVARVQMAAPVTGYVIAAEVEDTSARGWPARYQAGDPNPIAGPRVWVGLRQHRVTGSETFDWQYLASLWQIMQDVRSDWLRTRPGLPATHDRAAWKEIGSPAGLGYGFGHREATKHGVCMFGARIALPGNITLQDLLTELDDVGVMLLRLAEERRPTR